MWRKAKFLIIVHCVFTIKIPLGTRKFHLSQPMQNLRIKNFLEYVATLDTPTVSLFFSLDVIIVEEILVHFRVALNLSIKARLGAQPLISK